MKAGCLCGRHRLQSSLRAGFRSGGSGGVSGRSKVRARASRVTVWGGGQMAVAVSPPSAGFRVPVMARLRNGENDWGSARSTA